MRYSVLNIVIVFSTFFIVMSIVSSAWTAETTVIVDLNKKIRSDFIEIKKVGEKSQENIKPLNEKIAVVVGEIDNTNDEEKKGQLVDYYFQLRAKELYWEAWQASEMKRLTGNIILNLSRLKQEINRFGQLDNGQFLTPSDSNDVGQTLKGLAEIIAPMNLVKENDPRIQNLILSLKNLDMRYSAIFKKNSIPSVDEQLKYMEDLHGFIQSVMLVLDVERGYLQSTVFSIIGRRILGDIYSIQKSTYAPGGILSPSMEKHSTDNKVLGYEKVSESHNEFEFNPNNIGNYK